MAAWDEIMEKELFDWEDFNDNGDMIEFYDITLVRDIHPFEKGDRFDRAFISFEKGWLQFENDCDGKGTSEACYEYELGLVIK